MKRRFKTQTEFIDSVRSGDVWEYDGDKYFYDATKDNPFRVNGGNLAGSWGDVTTQEFTLVEPEPLYEERWQMLTDHDGHTRSTPDYYNQKRIDEGYPESGGWYKGPSIKVKVVVGSLKIKEER